MGTTINYNGSKWAGEDPDPIEKLEERLRDNVLDPTFEDYGGFADNCTDDRGFTLFFGNFYDVSGVFSIKSNDPIICARLIAAIKKNMGTQKYAEAKAARRAQKDEAQARYDRRMQRRLPR